jgi:site-specific DNA recombinase
MASAVRVILRNPLYCGRVRWNVSQFVRDPDSGSYKRRSRPQAEWVEHQDETLHHFGCLVRKGAVPHALFG